MIQQVFLPFLLTFPPRNTQAKGKPLSSRLCTLCTVGVQPKCFTVHYFLENVLGALCQRNPTVMGKRNIDNVKGTTGLVNTEICRDKATLPQGELGHRSACWQVS